MKDERSDRYYGIGVGMALTMALAGAGVGGGVYWYRAMRGPLDTHWTRELGSPRQPQSGDPGAADLRMHNPPFDWNAPQPAGGEDATE